MFTITEKAATEILASKAGLGDEKLCLRLSAKKTPNIGIAYNMGFDLQGKEDIHYDLNGVEVIVDAETDQNIIDMVMDFGVMEGQPQFIFSNPQDVTQGDSSSCGSTAGSAGCGTGCSCG